MNRTIPVLTTTFTALFAGTCLAQTERQLERSIRSSDSPSFRPSADTTLTLAERAQVDVGGTLNLTAAWLDDASGNSRRFFSPELLTYARLNLDGAHGFYLRARAAYREYSTGDSFDGRGDTWAEPYVDRYWYEFDLRRSAEVYQGKQMEGNISGRIGRQFVEWGTGLSLSEVVYAARPTFEFNRRWRLDGIAAVTPDHAVDFDTSRASFDRKTRRTYFGGMLTATLDSGGDVFGYAMQMSDKNSDTRARVGGATGNNFTRDSWYLGVGTHGNLGDDWLYMGEFTYQTGDSASDPLAGPQQINDLSAWAARAQFTKVFRDANQSRLQIEALIASGDKDRQSSTDTIGGNAPGTSDHGFNSLGFAYTGLAFSPSLSNLMSLRAGGATFPWRGSENANDLQLGADILASFKHNKSGGIDEATTASKYLGTEIDLSMNWRVSSDTAITARYGVFFPGDAIAGPKGPRHFILIGTSIAF